MMILRMLRTDLDKNHANLFHSAMNDRKILLTTSFQQNNLSLVL